MESWRYVFLGALGHDLRGPLAAVVGTAELLADTAQGTPHAHQAARILSGGQHLSRLVDGLLDYSKSTLGAGMQLQRTACDLGEAERFPFWVVGGVRLRVGRGNECGCLMPPPVVKLRAAEVAGRGCWRPWSG